MEFHLFLPQMRLSPEALVDRARAAEAAGFAGLAVMDHLSPPAAADQPMYEALTTVTWLAAGHRAAPARPLVLCDSFRHPAVLARQAVTLDHLSGRTVRARHRVGIDARASWPRSGSARPTAGQRLERLAETLALLTGGSGPVSRSTTTGRTSRSTGPASCPSRSADPQS